MLAGVRGTDPVRADTDCPPPRSPPPSPHNPPGRLSFLGSTHDGQQHPDSTSRSSLVGHQIGSYFLLFFLRMRRGVKRRCRPECWVQWLPRSRGSRIGQGSEPARTAGRPDLADLEGAGSDTRSSPHDDDASGRAANRARGGTACVLRGPPMAAPMRTQKPHTRKYASSRFARRVV